MKPGRAAALRKIFWDTTQPWFILFEALFSGLGRMPTRFEPETICMIAPARPDAGIM